MKAVRVNEFGKPVRLEDVQKPKPASDEALVQVYAASINPVDSAIMAGYLSFMTSVPLTLGTDFSGVVLEVGKDVTNVKPGDEVYGMIPMRSGSFSEFAVPKSNEMARKPRSLDHAHASTIPLPSMAAWQSLFEHGQFKKGERLLIHGVAGSVGGLAAQFARTEGAYIYGTDIPEKAAHVARLGIDRFIDSKSERFEDVVKNVDVVLDFVGGEFMQRSYTVLRPGGRYVTALAMDISQDEPRKLGITSVGFGAQVRPDLLIKIADLFDAGKLRTFVNRTFPLDDVQAALDYRLTSRDPGKVVLMVK